MTRSTGISGFFKKALSIFLLLCLLLTAVTFSSAAEKPVPKRVLVMYSYHEGLPWERIIDDSLRETLASKSTGPIELHVEHTDRVSYPDDEYLLKLVDLYRQKYSDPKMELVIGIDDEATDILLKHGEELFPGVPLVFVTGERKDLQRDFLKPNMTSLLWGLDLEGTVKLIQKILPETRHLFFISGSSLSDQALDRVVRGVFGGHTDRLDINYLSETTIEDLFQRVAQLPENSAIIYLAVSRDADGKSFVPREIMSVISEKANAPMFGIVGTYLGHGIVGGSLLSPEVQGKRCGEIGLSILRGESPADILQEKTLNVLMFDWRQLERWGISEDNLPPGSVVRYRIPSLWEEHKRRIIGITVLIIAQALLIFFLLVQGARRKRAEQSMIAAESNFRTVADFAYDWILLINLDGTLRYASPSCERITGYRAQEFISNPSLLREITIPEDRDIWKRHQHDSRSEQKPREIQFRIQRRDGEMRWIEHVCQPVKSSQGEAIGFRASNRDITVRKKREQDLRDAFSEIEQLKEQLEAESVYLQDEIKLEYNFEGIIGQSNALNYVFLKIDQIASTDSTVLMLGETGTGKELVARAIHAASPRNNRPLVKVNCAVLPRDLIESKLFGHEKGAFTGAHARQTGRFEVANGSTLFLDEIGELPLDLQAKLLRVLQDGEFERLGSSHTIKADVRIIAATNRNPDEEIRKGRFREDLYYRLNIFPITVPPLRKRTEDIPLLVDEFVKRSGKKMGKQIKTIPQSVMKTLQNYPWPGNIRELENVIERAVINTRGSKLQLADKIDIGRDEKMPAARRGTLSQIERDYIVQVLEETDWKVSGKNGAAEILGINPNTLRGRMRKLEIQKT